MDEPAGVDAGGVGEGVIVGDVPLGDCIFVQQFLRLYKSVGLKNAA